MKCEKCNVEIDGTYGSGRFCSRSCANSHIRNVESKKKTSNSMIKYYKKHPERLERLKIDNRHLHTKETKEKLSQIMKERAKNGQLDYFRGIGNNVHRKLEKEYKPKIERYFNTTKLFPKQIGNHWFDFVNDKYIIEFTIDSTAGITSAINRLLTLKDNRKKYLICRNKWFGKKRKEKLKKANAIFIPITAL